MLLSGLENKIRRTRILIPTLMIAAASYLSPLTPAFADSDPCGCKDKPKTELRTPCPEKKPLYTPKHAAKKQEPTHISAKPDTVYIQKTLPAVHDTTYIEKETQAKQEYEPPSDRERNQERAREESRATRKLPSDEQTRTTRFFLGTSFGSHGGRETADYTAKGSGYNIHSHKNPFDTNIAGGFWYSGPSASIDLELGKQAWKGYDSDNFNNRTLTTPAQYTLSFISGDFLKALQIDENSGWFFTPRAKIGFAKNTTKDLTGVDPETETSLFSIAGYLGGGKGRPNQSHAYAGLHVAYDQEDHTIDPDEQYAIENCAPELLSSGTGIGVWGSAELQNNRWIVTIDGQYQSTNGSLHEDKRRFRGDGRTYKKSMYDWEKTQFDLETRAEVTLAGGLGLFGRYQFTHGSMETTVDATPMSKMDFDRHYVTGGLEFRFDHVPSKKEHSCKPSRGRHFNPYYR
ncbi:MAG: hypothetical protein V1743_02570 [Nanoarchaeota archaeon]